MKIQVSLKSDKNNGTLREDQYTFLSHLAQFFFELKKFQTRAVELVGEMVGSSETDILYSTTFILIKSYSLCDNVEKIQQNRRNSR
jgi:hypothetical protein